MSNEKYMADFEQVAPQEYSRLKTETGRYWIEPMQHMFEVYCAGREHSEPPAVEALVENYYGRTMTRALAEEICNRFTIERGEPLRWLVRYTTGEEFVHKDAESANRWAREFGGTVEPLYRGAK